MTDYKKNQKQPEPERNIPVDPLPPVPPDPDEEGGV